MLSVCYKRLDITQKLSFNTRTYVTILKTVPILLCKIYRLQEHMKSTRTKQIECKLFSDQFCCSAIQFCLHYTMIRINQLLQSVKVSVNIYYTQYYVHGGNHVSCPRCYKLFIHSKIVLLQRWCLHYLNSR